MTNKTDYFKSFCKISKALGTTLGREQLLDLICQSSIDALNGKAACLFLADKEQDVFVPVAQKGLSENYLHAKPMRAKKVVDEFLHGGYLSITDATADPRLENHEEKKSEGIASILVVPVMVKDKTIGVLSLYTAEQRDFSDDEIEFQLALAEQGGMAIQQARLVARIEQGSTLFRDLAASINSSLDINKILHILTSEIADALALKGAEIRLINKDSGLLEPVASYALSEEYLKSGAGTDKCLQAALEGEVVVVEDATVDQRVGNAEAVAKEGIGSMLCIPMRSKGVSIGVMRLAGRLKRGFPDDVIRLVSAVADQGGLAIENARLFERIKENARLFFDLSSSINSSLDIKKILHILTAETADALGMKGVDIRLLNKDTDTLELVSSFGLSERFQAKGSLAIEKSVPQVLLGETVIIEDIETNGRIQNKEESLKEGIVSMLLVPIKSGDEVIGVMGLLSGEKRSLTEDDINLVNALAYQGGLAIQNASMYLMLQEDKKDLERDIWSHRTWF